MHFQWWWPRINRRRSSWLSCITKARIPIRMAMNEWMNELVNTQKSKSGKPNYIIMYLAFEQIWCFWYSVFEKMPHTCMRNNYVMQSQTKHVMQAQKCIENVAKLFSVSDAGRILFCSGRVFLPLLRIVLVFDFEILPRQLTMFSLLGFDVYM